MDATPTTPVNAHVDPVAVGRFNTAINSGKIGEIRNATASLVGTNRRAILHSAASSAFHNSRNWEVVKFLADSAGLRFKRLGPTRWYLSG